MKRDAIPYPCNICGNMKPHYLHMNGNHDYVCLKKPSSKWGDPNCDRLYVIRVKDEDER